ncbi:archaellin/type IV pilin N-terminal domain-containing protein [Methanoculleus taiwanensis]|nr:archaellin/type IV pilin N-terminal domain-containing protein [Methanoculleus taiwanensis]
MKNDEGFTGLEAAIVLIAFVVVAAVFSYVVLGAGFFTTQKSQEVVHTGVDQASSSMEIIGNTYGIRSAAVQYLQYVKFTIGNTAGGTGLDISKMTVSYSDDTARDADADYQTDSGYDLTDKLYTASATANMQWGVISKINADDDSLLEPGEQFIIGVSVPTSTTVNKPFSINLQPAVGAVFQIKKSVPAYVDKINILY